MVFYILAVIWAYLLFFLAKKSIFLYPILVFPLVIFSTYRGVSGKDTEHYLLRFELFDGWADVKLDSEPVLNLMIILSKSFGGSEVFFFIHSFTVVTLLFFVARKWEKSRYFLLLMGPVFLVDGITNGMRISLGASFWMWGAVYGGFSVISGFFLSFFSHITTSILIVLYYYDKFKNIHFGYKFLLGFFLVFSIYVFFPDESVLPRVYSKFYSYSEIEAKNLFSGLSDVYLFLVTFIIIGVYNKANALRDIFFAGLIALTMIMLVQVSVAFLRIEKLIIMSFLFSQYLRSKSHRIGSAIFFWAGLPYTINFLRQVYFDDGFLPYG